MIIDITLENFLSFKDKKIISFEKILKNTKHNYKEHTYAAKKSGKTVLEILRCPTFFGANGSGKSNISKSIKFLINRIVGKKVKNDRDYSFFHSGGAVCVAIRFLYKEKIFTYSIETVGNQIHKETLLACPLGHSKIEAVFSIEGALGSDDIKYSKTLEDKKQLVDIVLGGEKSSASALHRLATNTGFHKTIGESTGFLKDIKDAYEYLHTGIRVVSPDDDLKHLTYGLLSSTISENDNEKVGSKFLDYLKQLLTSIDAGIEDVIMSPMSQDLILSYVFAGVESHRNKMVEELTDKESFSIVSNHHGIYILYVVNKELQCETIKTLHRCKNRHKQYELNIIENSDGVKRLVSIGVALFSLSLGTVIVFDELENSLHPAIMKMIVKDFLEGQEDDNDCSQMILSTHEHSLFDSAVLRRDEMYIVEKENHESHVLRLPELANTVRFDTSLNAAFVAGYFGGKPNV